MFDPSVWLHTSTPFGKDEQDHVGSVPHDTLCWLDSQPFVFCLFTRALH
jgi:hypothetical protein